MDTKSIVFNGIVIIMIYIGNTFTCNFLSQLDCSVEFKTISWVQFDEIIASGDFINFMGHADVAHMVGLEQNRISVSAKPGDTIIFTQYRGPRLPEGTTVLPEGATIIPVMATIK